MTNDSRLLSSGPKNRERKGVCEREGRRRSETQSKHWRGSATVLKKLRASDEELPKQNGDATAATEETGEKVVRPRELKNLSSSENSRQARRLRTFREKAYDAAEKTHRIRGIRRLAACLPRKKLAATKYARGSREGTFLSSEIFESLEKYPSDRARIYSVAKKRNYYYFVNDAPLHAGRLIVNV